MADVFISYHEKSAGKLAAQIAKALEARGISCWYMERDSRHGRYPGKITKAIRESPIFVLILNQYSNMSKDVLSEVNIAFKHDREILPFRIDNCEMSDDLFYHLSTFTTINANPPNEQSIQELAEEIADILGEIPSAVSQIKSTATNTSPSAIIQSNSKPQDRKSKHIKNHSLEYDKQDFKSVILYMLRVLGTDIFQEPNRIYSIFYDFSPTLKPYANIMRQLAQHGALAELLAASHEGGIRQERAMMKARHVLENDLLLGTERVDYFLDILCAICCTRIIKSGECGTQGGNVIYTLDESGILTISGKGAMLDFGWDRTGILNMSWWNERETIAHVQIQHGVTTIGYEAFRSCRKLASVYIPDSVTRIGWDAFWGCTGLTSLHIPDSVTYIGDGAFRGCKGLKSVSIPTRATIDGYPGICIDRRP